MKKRILVAPGKAFTLLFCAFLLAESTACASKEAVPPQTQTASSAESSSEVTESAENEKVWDFDALANEEWLKEAEAKVNDDGYDYYSLTEASNEVLSDRVYDIFRNTDMSALSEDSDLYKALSVYNQLSDEDWQASNSITAVLDKLRIFDSISSLEDLYEISADPFFGTFNHGLNRYVEYDSGYSVNNFDPKTINYQEMSDDQRDALKTLFTNLGYDESRTDEIVANTEKIEAMIADYRINSEEKESSLYFEPADLDAQNVTVPVFDILKKLNALGTAEYFESNEDFPKFLNSYYTTENVPMIRDHMLASAAISLSRFIAADNSYTYYMFYRNDVSDFDENLIQAITMVSIDTITDEYNSRYINKEKLEDTKEMLEEIRTTMRDIISDSEWLTVHGKELAKRKVLRQNYYYAENAYKDDFSDVVLTDNPLDNYISLASSRIRFLDSQLFNKRDDLALYGVNMIGTNSFYRANQNAIFIFCGELDDDPFDTNDSFEEKLGSIGYTVAHEISHGYDPSGSEYDFEGYYDPWMTDEEYEAYHEKAEKIVEFFDGKSIGDGGTIDGELVCEETFSDIMAIACCLRILETRENPDYDAFFRSYAKECTYYYSPKGLEFALKDTHLPGKMRVNYVLGQFDRFYETYDVDPESPYYVPEDQRLSAF